MMSARIFAVSSPDAAVYSKSADPVPEIRDPTYFLAVSP